MVACSHGASLLVFNSIPRDYNSLYSHEIASLTLEEKFQINGHPCIILHILNEGKMA